MSAPVPVLPGMAVANGIALSEDGHTLWATEFASNRLHRVALSAPATIAPFGTAVPYHFIGGHPDSARTDSAGNVYVALYPQGRVLVFNRRGLPVAQILLPGRDHGHNLHSTSIVIQPGTDDLYIVSNDGEQGDRGAWIFRAKALVKAKRAFSHH